MLDYTELIARLRALKDFDIYREAADALEALQAEVERLENRIEDLTSEEHSIPELRQQIHESFEEKRKCYFAVSQYEKANANLRTERDALQAKLDAIEKQEPSCKDTGVCVQSGLYVAAQQAQPEQMPLTESQVLVIKGGQHD
jgi:chaperonin cofactor prefoldin